MLVKVSAGKGETYVEISLDDIAEVSVSRNGQPGYRYVRGARSYVKLKDGKEYLTSPDEAQRLVDAMREQTDNTPQLDEALALALTLSPKDQLRLIALVAASVERDIEE